MPPEHGARGDVQAGGRVDNEVDPETGLPIYSLYGEVRTPTKEMLSGIDVMIYDLQDVGVRYYTYLSTMLHVMQGCAQHGVPLLILDRLQSHWAKSRGQHLGARF